MQNQKKLYRKKEDKEKKLFKGFINKVFQG